MRQHRNGLFVQARNVHAAVAHHVNAVIDPQLFDHLGRGAQTREHAAMFCQKIEPVRIRQTFEFAGQLLAQAQHAQTDLFQLRLPVGAQFVVGQDHRHQPRPVVRREAEVLAVEKRQSALIQRLCARIRRHQHQNAGPLAVDAKVLRAACRNQTFRHSRSHRTGARRIRVQTVAKALIGDVDHRRGTGVLQNLNHLGPLVHRQVGAGRVVAAAVQQNHVVFGRGFQVFDHRVERHAARFAVEIAIRHHLDAQILQDRQMVRPCRI